MSLNAERPRVTGPRPRARRAALLGLGLELAIGASAAASGCGGQVSRGSAVEQRIIDVGIVGELPPRPGQRARALVAPTGVIRVPGRFPLGSLVRFRIPVRNDGPRPLTIRRLESG